MLKVEHKEIKLYNPQVEVMGHKLKLGKYLARRKMMDHYLKKKIFRNKMMKIIFILTLVKNKNKNKVLPLLNI